MDKAICPFCFCDETYKYFKPASQKYRYQCRNCGRSFYKETKYRKYITIGSNTKHLSVSKYLAIDLNLDHADYCFFVEDNNDMFIFKALEDFSLAYRVSKNKQGCFKIANVSLCKFFQEKYNINESFSLIIENNKVMRVIKRSEIDLKFSNNLYKSAFFSIRKGGMFSLSKSLMKLMNLKHMDSISFAEDDGVWFIVKTEHDYIVRTPKNGYACSFNSTSLYEFFKDKFSLLDNKRSLFVVNSEPVNEIYFRFELKTNEKD